MEHWEKVLWYCDSKEAKRLTSIVDNKSLGWDDVANALEYYERPMFENEVMTSHFRRVLVDLKLLGSFKGIRRSRLVKSVKIMEK
jgi:hypothetical protein